jgi:hypothetical protein
MQDVAHGFSIPPLDRYPWRIILFRWLLLAVEASIAVKFIIGFRFELAVIYIAYGVICLFLLLPLIRCVRCSYYGKRCNFGWGVWVSKVFPRDEVNSQSAFYGYTILFWPLRLLPIILGFQVFLNGFIGVLSWEFEQFQIIPHGLFPAYLLTIFLHRRFYRAAACVKCHERLNCPVYNCGVMLAHGSRPERMQPPAA